MWKVDRWTFNNKNNDNERTNDNDNDNDYDDANNNDNANDDDDDNSLNCRSTEKKERNSAYPPPHSPQPLGKRITIPSDGPYGIFHPRRYLFPDRTMLEGCDFTN